MSKYLLYWAAVLSLVACGDSAHQPAQTQAGTALVSSVEFSDENSVRFSGKVIENHLGCTVDGLCFLKIAVDGSVVVVVYSGDGDAEVCVNRAGMERAMTFAPGDSITVYAQVLTGDPLREVTICPSQRFYAK